ncbi:hypothetical protein JOB18_029007 [Solea senegalensis]|uniref:Uncharacterized protein n=1 Tax=Solea senegalensis TaxID=28829 RepID=A0AAV6S4K1_SOLSE|nr:hypothetical protein JOB18_029007 [Solea senegalensis]
MKDTIVILLFALLVSLETTSTAASGDDENDEVIPDYVAMKTIFKDIFETIQPDTSEGSSGEDIKQQTTK